MGFWQAWLETMVVSPSFWAGRRVLITGHTGFKGAWLALALNRLGAKVSGYALAPEGPDSLFQVAGVEADLEHHVVGDIRDFDSVSAAMATIRPEIVFHLAAQALVRPSYDDPVETFDVNVMGTIKVMEAARAVPGLRAMLIVTSDKSYENVGQLWGYRETDRMGGHDPYSASKGAAEIAAEAMRRSFFGQPGSAAVASVRAGNVIGGGDWSRDRLVPDIMRGFLAGESVTIRNPDAVRPWQHVLDPVLFYILVAQRLCEDAQSFSGGWNVGPGPDGEVDVATLVAELARLWGGDRQWRIEPSVNKHEAAFLTLDCTKARRLLGWKPALTFDAGLELTSQWYRQWSDGADMRSVTLAQIAQVLTP